MTICKLQEEGTPFILSQTKEMTDMQNMQARQCYPQDGQSGRTSNNL
jgi:hypothetical protein